MPVDADQAKLHWAKLRWEEGIPVSARFADAYHARDDGLAEKRHVFLGGNALPERWQGAERFRIAELGFGTGLAILAAWQLWRRAAAAGAVLEATSFERWPLGRAEMARALGRWPELGELAEALLARWTGRGGTLALPGLRLEIVVGDARATVPRWQGRADAWFLDGFAPARNPEMWEPALLRAVFERTALGGTLATYSAAGNVRRRLEAAGFRVERGPGFATKREMLFGERRISD
jgi:tRNA U34 5-methylaminomethyl-2-thiouridine-forming methyltransferase MnmC